MTINLDSKEMIKRFHGFIDEYLRIDLRSHIEHGKEIININFESLIIYDQELAECFFDRPRDCLELFHLTMKQFSESADQLEKTPQAFFYNFPNSEKISIRKIRSQHIDKLVCFEGIIKRKSDIKPELTPLEYLCTNPDWTYSTVRLKLPQTEEKLTTLKACPRCKAPMDIVKKVRVDTQTMLIVEDPNSLNDKQLPKEIYLKLHSVLTSPVMDDKHSPGEKIEIIGILKEVNKKTRQGLDSVRSDLIVDVICINKDNLEEENLTLSKEDIQEFKDFVKDSDFLNKIVLSVGSSLNGMLRIKEALILQLVGGGEYQSFDGSHIRGLFHIFLIGDPGLGKTQLMRIMKYYSSKYYYISGDNSTKAGIVGAVVKDELTGEWSLEAGAFVLASGGLCCIDEIDKLEKEDIASLHEGLESQQITFAKATIRQSLKSVTKLLAGANPTRGRFDPFGENIGKQIKLAPALLSRFDLIFPMQDIPDKKRDQQISKQIFKNRYNAKANAPDITPLFIKKFIIFSQSFKPVMSEALGDFVCDHYVKIRTQYEDNTEKPIPITPRQLEAIFRLSEAYCKIRLSNKVEEKDVLNAIDIFNYSLERLGIIDSKTGDMDIDKLMTGTSTDTRNNLKLVTDIIKDLEKTIPQVTYQSILKVVRNHCLNSNDLNRILETLKKEGTIFEPRKDNFKIIE